MTIKAIETEYNGYRFRSRLEARWAVFFDAMGIKYEYEPEGFDLPSGRYLPDFFLKDFGVYVEIKPFDRTVVTRVGDKNKWEQKCSEFRDSTGMAILLCYDDPSQNVWKMLYAIDTCDGGGGSYDCEAVFQSLHGKAYIVVDDLREDRTIYVKDFEKYSKYVLTAYEFAMLQPYQALREFADKVMCTSFDPDNDDMLNQAKKAARQARFEFGETPVVPHGR